MTRVHHALARAPRTTAVDINQPERDSISQLERPQSRAAESGEVGDIPGLPVDSEPGQACVADIRWALTFAAANREAIISAAMELVQEVTGVAADPSSRIDVHHNFVEEEEHFGQKLWIHRKGAIAAPAGARVLIPGSMGTASYIAEGLGEATSFRSASHGAGRVMTRREAR